MKSNPGFVGTGNISYELASRGVINLTAVDQNKHCTYFIHQTAKSFEMPIVVTSARKADQANGSFDFVRLPPYAFTQEQLGFSR